MESTTIDMLANATSTYVLYAEQGRAKASGVSKHKSQCNTFFILKMQNLHSNVKAYVHVM